MMMRISLQLIAAAAVLKKQNTFYQLSNSSNTMSDCLPAPHIFQKGNKTNVHHLRSFFYLLHIGSVKILLLLPRQSVLIPRPQFVSIFCVLGFCILHLPDLFKTIAKNSPNEAARFVVILKNYSLARTMDAIQM